MKIAQLRSEIAKIGDPHKRRVFFMAVLSKCLETRGIKAPVIVGGEAVEIYTQGAYSTGDIDLKCDYIPLKEELSKLGVQPIGGSHNIFGSKELDIYIHWLGATLDEGPEAESRVNTVKVQDGLSVTLVSIEDLIIDRLCAVKQWGDRDSMLWARNLFKIGTAINAIDKTYLQNRATIEDVEDVLQITQKQICQNGDLDIDCSNAKGFNAEP